MSLFNFYTDVQNFNKYYITVLYILKLQKDFPLSDLTSFKPKPKPRRSLSGADLIFKFEPSFRCSQVSWNVMAFDTWNQTSAHALESKLVSVHICSKISMHKTSYTNDKCHSILGYLITQETHLYQ